MGKPPADYLPCVLFAYKIENHNQNYQLQIIKYKKSLEIPFPMSSNKKSKTFLKTFPRIGSFSSKNANIASIDSYF